LFSDQPARRTMGRLLVDLKVRRVTDPEPTAPVEDLA
jgi:hypothetical protein